MFPPRGTLQGLSAPYHGRGPSADWVEAVEEAHLEDSAAQVEAAQSRFPEAD